LTLGVTYTVPNLQPDLYLVAVSDADNDQPNFSTFVTINTIPSPTITLGANPGVCLGELTASLTYSATTGTPDQYSINFDAAAEAQGFTDVVNAALPASPISIVIPGGAVAGVYDATISVQNTTTGCSSTPTPISVTVNANPTITLGANPT